jgi:predicted enzyme related to lactoylglutathione lyase
MGKVLGVGGIFFKSADPEKLGNWYKRWLGVKAEPGAGANFGPQDMPPNSVTVWSPFAADTTYFAPSTRDFMINLVVDNLEEALQQVKEGGAEVVGSETYDYGKFGWFIDPDGNKVELWEPAG